MHTGGHDDGSAMLVLVVCIVIVIVLDDGCIVSERSMTMASTIRKAHSEHDIVIPCESRHARENFHVHHDSAVTTALAPQPVPAATVISAQ